MFTENKYTKWYFAIIANAKARQLTEYYEIHHVIPRCLGGDDSPSNLVQLTGREHFICHLLLTKMHASHKLQYALICMTLKNPHQKLRYVPNSRSYEKIKSMNAELARLKFTGKQKHNVGKKRAYNPETGEVRLFAKDAIPEGWIAGNSPSMKMNQTGKNKGKVYYNNLMTGKTIALSKGEKVPDGFVKGNQTALAASKKAAEKNTGTILCHNPITMETKRCHNIPDGWVKGSAFIWINNGVENKQHLKHVPLPEGWAKGRLNWR